MRRLPSVFLLSCGRSSFSPKLSPSIPLRRISGLSAFGLAPEPTGPTRFIRLSGVIRHARRKDVIDALSGLQFDPSKLIAKYNLNYLRLEDWNCELASEAETEKAKNMKISIGGKPIKISPISEEVYMRERDRILNYDGGKAVLINNLPTEMDSGEMQRFFLGYGINNIVILKDEKGRPAGRVIVVFNSEQEAHRAVLEKHRKLIYRRAIEVEILD